MAIIYIIETTDNSHQNMEKNSNDTSHFTDYF
jgi:hypothetical protein